MARLFDGRRALKVNDNSAVMSEQEDIDSNYMPGDSDHEHSMISVTESVDDLNYSSHSGCHRAAALGDRDIRDESDVESENDVDSESETSSEEYYSSDPSVDEDDDQSECKEDDFTDCSPTSVSDPLEDSSGKDLKNKDRKDSKKGGFFGRLFGGIKKKDIRDETSKSMLSSKSILSNKSKKSKNRKSDLPDGDEDRDQLEAQSFSVHVFDDISESQQRSYSVETEDDVSHPEAHGQYDDEVEIPLAGGDSKGHTQEGRRKKYEGKMTGVTEEREGNESSRREKEYRSYAVPIKGGNQEHNSPNSGHVKKRVEDIHSMIKEINDKKDDIPVYDDVQRIISNDPHHVSPDNADYENDDNNDTPDLSKVKPKRSKSIKSSFTRKSKKKKKRNSHPSASAARDHGTAVSNRIDHTGQISTVSGPVSAIPVTVTHVTVTPVTVTPVPVAPDQHADKLKYEVHKLRTVVELMMTRMELYERQSECLLEAADEDHTREWKVATIEKKRGKKSRVDEKLSDIKNLLIERSAQDKWIRQLEGIEREYRERLVTTEKQLRALRYEHITTSKKIKDMRKDKLSVVDSGNTENTQETVGESTKNLSYGEALAPVANNVALARWTGESTLPPIVHVVPGESQPEDASFSESKTTARDPDGRKIATMLEEMIVSWHTTATDMSPLSDKRLKKKKKKDKDKDKDKKKKKKKRKEKEFDTGAIL